jgi:hypothetical protein
MQDKFVRQQVMCGCISAKELIAIFSLDNENRGYQMLVLSTSIIESLPRTNPNSIANSKPKLPP